MWYLSTLMSKPNYIETSLGLKLDRGWGPGVTINPEREAAWDALTAILTHGYKLTVTDIGEICTHYGYSPESVTSFINSYTTHKALGERGINLTKTKHSTEKRIYFDESYQ
jgi:hypothetical protein